MKAKFEEIVNVAKIGTTEAGIDLPQVTLMADREEKKPASLDVDRVEIMMIDNQFDFISPQGALPVVGAVEDTERLCRFIYKYLDLAKRRHLRQRVQFPHTRIRQQQGIDPMPLQLPEDHFFRLLIRFIQKKLPLILLIKLFPARF